MGAVNDMIVERDRVVRFHFDLSAPSAGTLDSTRDGEPRAILYGREKIMPGIERVLAGRTAGDRFEVELRPEEAYGLRHEGRTRRVSKKHFFGPRRFAVGKTAWLRTREGPRPVTVLKVGSSVVDVDLNHPLAGLTVHADMEIVEVRAADHEEIAHGHVHGPEGHEH